MPRGVPAAEFDVYKTNTTILKDLVGAKVRARMCNAWVLLLHKIVMRYHYTTSKTPALRRLRGNCSSYLHPVACSSLTHSFRSLPSQSLPPSMALPLSCTLVLC
jgi:hypothetical protein